MFSLRGKIKIVFLLLLAAQNLFAQTSSDYIITASILTAKDGLAGKQVNCGIQDSRGFIWFGTEHGLQRYDGKNFRLYTKEKNSLQENNIALIAEDQQQRLWIMYGISGTDRYLSGKGDILDLNTGSIQSIEKCFENKFPIKKENKIIFIKSNERNELLIGEGYNNNLDVETGWLLTGKDTFKNIDIKGFSGAPHSTVFRDSLIITRYENDLLLISVNGMRVKIGVGEKPYAELMPLSIAKNNRIFAVEAIDFYYRYVGDETAPPFLVELSPGGNRLKPPTKLFTMPFKPAEEWRPILLNDSKSPGSIFAIKALGIFLFDGKELIQLLDTLQLSQYKFPRLFSYFSTNNNQHWLCTEAGVIKITVRENHFEHLLSSDALTLPLPSDHQCRSIYADGDTVYSSSWHGFYRISKNKENEWEHKLLFPPEAIASGDGFYFDGKCFWLNWFKNGMMCYNPVSTETKLIPTDARGIWAGITTNEKRIVLGGYNSLNISENNSFREIAFCNDSVPVKYWIYQLLYTSDKKLWAISNNGILEIENGCVAARYSADAENEKFRIPYSDIHGVYEDKNKNIWMATNGAGLIKWDRRKNISEQFTIADGLSSNVLYSVVEDEKGFYWLSSEYGLMRFDPVSHSVKTYTTENGLTDNEFNRTSYFKAKDGRLFFGGLNGINAFYPKDFRNDTSSLNVPLRIISFNQFSGKEDKLLDKTKEFSINNQITLNPGDRFFTLEFQLLDYAQESHRYAYKIEGVDKDWNYISENSVRLSGLPYGNFVLKIKAQNAAGEWSADELSIPVEVIKPVYLRTWFIALAFLLAAISIMAFINIRTRQLRIAKEKLEKKVEERTEELRSTLNEKENLLGQKEELMKEIHHRVKNNLQVISSLLDLQGSRLQDKNARAALEEGKGRVQSIAILHHQLYQHEDISRIELGGFTRELSTQVMGVFNKPGQQTELDIDIPQTMLDIDTAVPLGLILNELLTNSFKYAAPAFSPEEEQPEKMKEASLKIKISFFQSSSLEDKVRKWKLIYRDNGPGLPAGFDFNEAQSLGLKLVSRLSRQLKGSTEYRYNEGAEFTIHFQSGTIQNI